MMCTMLFSFDCRVKLRCFFLLLSFRKQWKFVQWFGLVWFGSSFCSIAQKIDLLQPKISKDPVKFVFVLCVRVCGDSLKISTKKRKQNLISTNTNLFAHLMYFEITKLIVIVVVAAVSLKFSQVQCLRTSLFRLVLIWCLVRLSIVYTYFRSVNYSFFNWPIQYSSVGFSEIDRSWLLTLIFSENINEKKKSIQNATCVNCSNT